MWFFATHGIWKLGNTQFQRWHFHIIHLTPKDQSHASENIWWIIIWNINIPQNILPSLAKRQFVSSPSASYLQLSFVSLNSKVWDTIKLFWKRHIIMSHSSRYRFRRRTSHEPNRMQMRENKGFCSFAFDSAHVKYGVWTWPYRSLCWWHFCFFLFFSTNSGYWF